ncbi:DegT/DnrJ/EryC1/StrS family aminotransferase [bacterium]|nr:DegT/DnrJ/EryC1/StrS family aminotransferase [bacterium]
MPAPLALTGGSPAVTLKPQPWPLIGDQEVQWMEEVVRSGKWSWMGPHETAFTEEFRQFLGANYAMCVSNGTVSIQCALQAVGVEPGDEVIVPGLTWVATAQAALDIGAQVVLVDIDPETLCLDPQAVAAALTPRTKAIIPVQLYGCMCDMDALGELARKHDLKIVEDVAHQHGSQWRGVGAGALGDAGSFSFQQSKVLTSGEGGFVTCRDEEAFQVAFALKQVGWTPPPDMKPAGHYGHNYRITEMQCVLLRGGLSRLQAQTEQRDANVQALAAGLQALGGPLRAARRDPRVTRQAYYAMTMVFDPAPAEGVTRSQYLQALAAEGFYAGETYDPVYRNPLLNLYDRTSPIPYRQDVPQDYASLRLPGCEQAKCETAVVMSHTQLLAEQAFVGQLLEAVGKVNGQLEAVRKHFASQ